MQGDDRTSPNADALARALARSAADAVALVAGWRGAFALQAADAASGRAFAAVDRFSIRTLCYRVADGKLHVAERAEELAGPGTTIDPQAIYDYLYFHCIPAPRTIFQDVFRIPAGHCVLLENGRLTVAPHWVPTFEEPASRPDFARLADTFRQTLRTAVERQLDGGLPACFLSGGTDSSTVAGMISAVAGRQAHTFSIGFEAEGYDEMAFARIASGHFKTQHHEYYVTPDDLVRSIPAVAQHYDQPFGNSSALPAYYCAKMAREAGATRVLAGDGGDELFGGNTRYAKQRVFGIYGQLPAALRSLVLQPLLQGSPLGRLPLLRKGRSYIEQARVPMPDRMQTYNLLERLGIREVLGDGILGHADPEAPHRLQREVWALARTNDEVNRMLAFDWRFTLADCDLPKVSGTTALAGIEVGFPMLDGDLVDFSCVLPVNYKLKRLALRWFFKEALRGFLPDEVITKKKQGFGLPFGVWATRHDGLKALAVDSLQSLGARGVVRPAFVQALVNDRLPEHPGYYGEMIWILMMLEQWLRKYAPDQRF